MLAVLTGLALKIYPYEQCPTRMTLTPCSSRFTRFKALACINNLRESATSLIKVEKIPSASLTSAILTCSKLLLSELKLVSHS